MSDVDLFCSLHHSTWFFLEQELQGLQTRPWQGVQTQRRNPCQSTSPERDWNFSVCYICKGVKTFSSVWDTAVFWIEYLVYSYLDSSWSSKTNLHNRSLKRNRYLNLWKTLSGNRTPVFIHCRTFTMIITCLPDKLYKNNRMEFKWGFFLGMKAATPSFLLLNIFFQASLLKI